MELATRMPFVPKGMPCVRNPLILFGSNARRAPMAVRPTCNPVEYGDNDFLLAKAGLLAVKQKTDVFGSKFAVGVSSVS